MLSKLADLTLVCWFIFFDDFAVCLEYLEIVHHLNILEQGSAPGQQGFDPTVRSEQHPIAVSTRRHSEHRWASARAPPTPLLGGWAEGGRCGACLIDDDEDDGDDHADEEDDDDDDDDDDDEDDDEDDDDDDDDNDDDDDDDDDDDVDDDAFAELAWG